MYKALLAVTLLLIAFSTAQVVCHAQQLDLSNEELSELVKLGAVSVSSKPDVKLTFPDGFMDDEVRGAVLLVNDSDEIASVSHVTTSCGCTTAIPVEKSVAPGGKNVLLFHYKPKSVGDAKIQAAFRFGGKEFRLQGVAKTKPRFQQSVASLTFETDHVDFVLTKKTLTSVDRLVVFPEDLRLTNFKDTPATVSATLLRSDDMPREFLLSPAFGDKTYKQMRFELKYKGAVEILPRRLIANRDNLRFYLRGDVASLDGAETMMIDEQKVACKASLQGTVLFVEFKNIFESGEHRPTVKIKEISFPLTVSAR